MGGHKLEINRYDLCNSSAGRRMINTHLYKSPDIRIRKRDDISEDAVYVLAWSKERGFPKKRKLLGAGRLAESPGEIISETGILEALGEKYGETEAGEIAGWCAATGKNGGREIFKELLDRGEQYAKIIMKKKFLVISTMANEREAYAGMDWETAGERKTLLVSSGRKLKKVDTELLYKLL
jgi:hypothetical protein